MAERIKQRPWELAAPDHNVTYENASLVDPSSGTVKRGTSFTIRDGKFVDVWTISDKEDSPRRVISGKLIDLQDRFVCPGLIDCHVHLTATPGDVLLRDMYNAETSTLAFRSAFLAREMLLRGFTTVRDTGGADAGLRDSIDEGLVKGPRLFIAGKALSQTGGHGDFRARHVSNQHQCCGDIPGLSRVCDGVPQCLEAVRDEIRKGADFIKIMCGGGVATLTDPLTMLQFTPEEIQAITSTAAYSGKYVTAHAYTPQAIRHAVDNGVRGIEHGNFVDRETAVYLKEKNVVVTPTLVVYQAYEIANKPPFDNLLTRSSKEKNREVLASGLESLKILEEAGVTMCYGSDLLSVLHPLQSGEFSIRSQVLSASSILRSATTNAAEYLGMQEKLGCIKPGAFADFVVLNENPLEDITVLDRVKDSFLAIVKDGRVVASKIDGLAQDTSYHSFTLE
ncbi:hypothetical protein FSARC_1156 [Fusarium sarcochroum]|uniref:Amidohydrolase-related domain-containing protein n=1 Tax=Fusarium sarcochroum TaxID=1208366 RepID=A0A8H4XFI9_9HYPO|nr:hypothetical protein FSARC_1156 [Fusarium sarcochroum]